MHRFLLICSLIVSSLILAQTVFARTAFAQATLMQAAEIPAAKPAEVGMSAEKLAKVDAAMEESVEQNQLPGAVVIIARRGKIVLLKAYGSMDADGKRPMQTDSIFRIFSMTKSVATAAALMLYEEGKLDLDDPVSKYIPELARVSVVQGTETRPAKSVPTIADLMRHTSGYSYGKSKVPLHDLAFKQLNPTADDVTLEEMQKTLGELPLAFEPGTDWMYGISTDILGRVIEIASGETLDQFLQRHIFDPLEMYDTGFHVPTEKLDRFTMLSHSDGKGTLTIEENPKFRDFLSPPVFKSGGGGLVSTARDYMRFLQMIVGEGEFQGQRYLKPETVALMTTNQVPSEVGWIKLKGIARRGIGFGFGFNVRVQKSFWDPAARVGEYGWGGVASTHYWVSPKDELAVVTLEQVIPYSFLTEFKLKGMIYNAINE